MGNNKKHTNKFLDKMPNKSGLTAPNSYFSEVEETLYLNYLENSFSKTEGFDVPKNYFSSLEDTLINNINKTPKRKVISFPKKVINWIPTVAAVIAVLWVFNFFDPKVNTVTDDEIMGWVEANFESITYQDLALILEDSDFEVLEESATFITENSLEEYFKYQDISNLLEDY